MPCLRTRLVRFWLSQILKRRMGRKASARDLRRITNQITWWGRPPAGVDVEESTVNGCNAEWHSPQNGASGNVVLYLHGGGYNFGSTANYREFGSRLALSCQARILMPDYRLAPEHPHPAAVEDALACYRWLLEQQVPPARLAVAGDSAGGGLTLALLLKLKDEELPQPAAAVCLSPWADLSCTGEAYEQLSEIDPMMTRKVLLGCAERYAAGRDVSDTMLSPVHGDFTGLPPLLIQVGADEILLSDSERVYEAAKNAGVEATLDVLKDLWHVSHLFARVVPEVRPAIADIGNFVRRAWTAD